MLFNDLIWSALEWVKTADENLGKAEQAIGSLVIFMEPAKDSISYQFTKKSACRANTLLVRLCKLFSEELRTVHKETVNFDRLVRSSSIKTILFSKLCNSDMRF